MASTKRVFNERHFRKAVENQDLEVEWQVFFTKAELYLTRFATISAVFIIWLFLLRNMHNPKLRVYLFAVLMFRTYLEHFDGINEMHIR